MTNQSDDIARTRFMIIGLTRLAGAICVAVALLSVAGAIDFLGELPAYAVLILGLIGTFIAPRLLAKRWRTPEH